MCGIAGIINKKNSNIDLSLSMKNMLTKIAHRGPDGEGIYKYEQLILGHRRLAILDLSQDGIQPMLSPCENYVLVFNGEIYNYLEIKNELIQLGHFFKTKTDTEVILHAYQEWGEDCVLKFNGMWAFVLLDKKKHLLFCSRDRFGVKPFYFINNEQFFIFCSEIKGITSYLQKKLARLDSIFDFILTSKTDHEHLTFFKDIVKLPASHNLIYELKKHTSKLYRYYELKPKTNEVTPIEYMDCLNDAISLRLRSDVKVGTCLSGGLDSSTVASLAGQLYQQQTNHPFSAITAISEQASNDESHFAQKVVDHCRLEWIKTKPSYADFHDQLEHIVYTQEEPFASPSIVMQYQVMKTAREWQIPVLLDGQGGDETLLGYERYIASHAYEEYCKYGLRGFISSIMSSQNNNSKLSVLKTAQYFFGTHFPVLRYHLHRLEHRYLSSENIKMPTHLKDYANASRNLFELQKLEIESTNLPALLRFEDKNSMSHSIETRLPFLDYRAVEMALSLPFEFKIHQGWSKHLLRKAMQNKLPDNILWRKNKFGFEAPEKIWLTRHKEIMNTNIKQSKLIRELTKKSLNTDALSNRTLWRLYSISLWEKQFQIEGVY